MFRTNCSMYEEVAMGNPGKVPYCSERDEFEPDCQKCKRPNYTKGDKIRHMSDKKLAELFANNNCGYCQIHDFCFSEENSAICEDMWLKWLRKEAET